MVLLIDFSHTIEFMYVRACLISYVNEMTILLIRLIYYSETLLKRSLLIFVSSYFHFTSQLLCNNELYMITSPYLPRQWNKTREEEPRPSCKLGCPSSQKSLILNSSPLSSVTIYIYTYMFIIHTCKNYIILFGWNCLNHIDQEDMSTEFKAR